MPEHSNPPLTEPGKGKTFSLEHKVALVTGGGRGIGSGIVEVFLEAGAHVVVNALTNVHLDKLVARLAIEHGDRILGIVGDIAEENSARAIVERATLQAGPIDILVNGAGDAVVGNLLDVVDSATPAAGAVAKMHSILDLNLMSAVYCARLVAPAMIQQKKGRIINLAGVIGGLRGESGLSLYSAAKAGLIGFTKTMAREWASEGVTVNAIAPGVYPDKANLTSEHYAMIETAYIDRIPLRRFGTPREVGFLALYLASEEASYLTGQVIALDGGLSA